jgi:hypothetical protein
MQVAVLDYKATLMFWLKLKKQNFSMVYFLVVPLGEELFNTPKKANLK